MANFSKLIFYYFSGTGNSANVARWITQIVRDNGMETELVNIAHCDRLNVPTPPKGALIAFCSPVHGFNYPPVMQSFIRKFPRGNNPVLLLNTRAGMLIGKWITPGLSGITFYFAALTLWLKGYHIKAMFPVDLPSNWISVHPGLNFRTVKYLHERNKERIIAFTHKILEGINNFQALREIIPDLIVSPISIAYYIVGRFVFAKTYFATKACDNCDVCIKQCPVHAIKKVDNRPYWTYKCESCMHCMSYCPQKAIETAHGSIAGFMILFSVVTWSFVEKSFGQVLHLDNSVVNFVIQSLLMLALLAVWYHIFHFLLRYKWFSKLLASTSLTHYKFWGKRYKALKD